MHDLYDRLENRSPVTRESVLLRDLAHVLSVSKSRVPALRAQLKGVDVGKLLTRADLTKIPVRRARDILASQVDNAPFGGYAATRLAALSQVFVGPGALVSISGQAKDWWGMARALCVVRVTSVSGVKPVSNIQSIRLSALPVQL